MLKFNRLPTVAAAALLLLLGSSTSFAGRYNSKLNIGDKAPDFQNIIGVDDKEHSLSDYKDAKAIVLIFTCNSCPVAQACEHRFIELQKDYESRGVQVIAINVNNLDEDKLPAMKKRAKQHGFPFPYLYDPTQKVARDYGAAVTPHIFVLDQNRKLVYMGAPDDAPLNESHVKKNYLRDALNATLSGKKPAISETRQKGCGIQYD